MKSEPPQVCANTQTGNVFSGSTAGRVYFASKIHFFLKKFPSGLCVRAEQRGFGFHIHLRNATDLNSSRCVDGPSIFYFCPAPKRKKSYVGFSLISKNHNFSPTLLSKISALQISTRKSSGFRNAMMRRVF